jgi:hypothetical protein
MVHDVVLLARAGGAGFLMPAYLSSTIAGNLPIALVQLAHGIAMVTPQSFVWPAMILTGLCFNGTRRYAIAGISVLVVYAFLPLAYQAPNVNYALDASSFRFALPALACGALVTAMLLPRMRLAGVVALYAVAVWGAWTVLAVFWNDAYTHWGPLVAAVAVAAALCTRATRGASVAIAIALILIAGRWGASSRAQGFYADWMRDPSGKPTGVFAWIAANRPSNVVAENVRIGAVLMMSPQSRVVDAPLGTGCARAQQQHALLLAGSNETSAPAQLAQAFADARACGAVLYEDGAAVVVQPR